MQYTVWKIRYFMNELRFLETLVQDAKQLGFVRRNCAQPAHSGDIFYFELAHVNSSQITLLMLSSKIQFAAEEILVDPEEDFKTFVA